jgi:hypothetical protein
MNWYKEASDGEWHPVEDGKYLTEEHTWLVKDLIRAAESLPVHRMNVNELVDINRGTETKEGNWGSLIDNPSEEFRKRVERADRSYPILVDVDGWIIDGSHRLAGAYWAGEETVPGKVMRPDDFPDPLVQE